MYKVILAFPERYDGEHEYAVGSTYPREGFTPPEGRIKELLDGSNRARQVYLEEVVETAAEGAVATPRPRKKKE